MRKLLMGTAATLSAIVTAGGLAYAVNLPLVSGASIAEPNQEIAVLNGIINSLNFGTSGILGTVIGPIGTTVATTTQNFTTTQIVTGQLTAAGQSLHAVCSGNTAQNTDTKNASLTIGAATISTNNFGIGAQGWNWRLEMTWTAATSPVTASYVWNGFALVATAPVASATQTATPFTVVVGSGADKTSNLGNAPVTIACSYTQGSATANDMTMETFVVDQMK